MKEMMAMMVHQSRMWLKVKWSCNNQTGQSKSLS
jgi:hypothetical protein